VMGRTGTIADRDPLLINQLANNVTGRRTR